MVESCPIDIQTPSEKVLNPVKKTPQSTSSEGLWMPRGDKLFVRLGNSLKAQEDRSPTRPGFGGPRGRGNTEFFFFGVTWFCFSGVFFALAFL